MGLFSKKSKTVQTTTIDPRLMNYAYDTLNNFDTMYGGVRNRFTQNPPSTYVAGFSPDTQKAQDMTRSFAAGATANDMRNLAGVMGTYRTSAAGLTDPNSATNAAVTSAMGTMGQLSQRQAPQFAAYQTLTGDQAAAQSMQAAQMQAAQMQAAQVGDVANIAARQGADYMNSYMNPYLQQVVDTSLADYDVGVDRQSAQNRARRDAGSAFGDRAAIADAVFSADSNRGRGSLSANLRSDAFNTAANFGMQDSSRFLEADRSNQQVALQRAMENARLQQAAAEANARMQQEAYQANAGFTQDASSSNARMAQETAFKNTDISNQFKLTNDQRLRDYEMQKFNAGVTNDELALRAAQAQAGTAQNQNTTQASVAQIMANMAQGQAGLLSEADNAELRRISALAGVGAQIDAREQAMLDEARNYLQLRAQLQGAVPVQQTVTTTNKSSPSVFDILAQAASTASGFAK
jgi:hypothetical protein